MKFRSRITTKSPNAIVRSRTSIRASEVPVRAGVAPASLDFVIRYPGSYAKRVVDEREDAACNDDQHDSGRDRRGGRLADRR